MVEEKTSKREGWGLPQGSKKWHYFVIEEGHTMGDTLCRSYGFYGGKVEQGNDDSPDNCSRCRKLLENRKG